jgi:predicted DNA-binding transcriptional regulator YafY
LSGIRGRIEENPGIYTIMRADRLLSLIMLLQSRQKMTARSLARELEVSERTIYRDIQALSAAGMPVYGESGPEGGFSLVESYRTSLTGLTAGEVRALFMLSIPAPLVELGVSQELRLALHKLAASLSDSQRQEEVRARQRFYLDFAWWQQGDTPIPHLQAVYQAVWQDRKLLISYRPHYLVTVDLVVDPYGLVAKAGVWYLVCGSAGQVRVYQVSDLLEAAITGEASQRPVGFDLGAFWKDWCAKQEAGRSAYPVSVRVAPGFLLWLPVYFGGQLVSKSPSPDADGWLRVELSFENLHAARDRLLDCGGGVEVLAPLALRKSVLDYARQIVELYKE